MDPGLDRTGYGIIESGAGRGGNGAGGAAATAPTLVEAGLVRTPTGEPLPRRLKTVGEELGKLITQHRPDCLAVEDLYSHYKTPQPAILMGHVRGVVLQTAAASGLPVISYLPTRVKRAVVGRGHASKQQIARLVQMRLKLVEDVRVPADVTDALAVALTHADALARGPGGAGPRGRRGLR